MASTPSKTMRKVLQAGNGLHVALYRQSSGKFANRIANLPVLLITTFGRKSGKPYTNPVVYIKEGQDFVVSATNGGSDTVPGWYLNLKSRPEAQIEVGQTVYRVQVTITEGEERSRLYEKFKTASSNFVKYEKDTSRVLPVIRLTPINQKEV
ncbi:MAG: nitroreductase family deazaflavin-dependent oxidoreductase [Anaerolineae bacterium]|nr:nitroreductase family deazaflavin-dependent oxidoreductase [Anaerolineae bacterium]